MIGKPRGAALLTGALGAMLVAGTAVGQTLDQIIGAEERRIQQAQEAQDQIDSIVDTTRARIDEYRSVMREVDGLVVYNTLLERQIADQEQELSDLRTSIDNVTVIERQVLPLMTRMIDGLQQFITLDMPFLLEDRNARVAQLQDLLERADVSTAEQFRNVLEAWQIESEYGRTIEAYTGELEINGATREVDFLKIGRIALIYQTPDGAISAAWDQGQRQWVELGNEHAGSIRRGLRIARQQVAPDLFVVPVPAPEEG